MVAQVVAITPVSRSDSVAPPRREDVGIDENQGDAVAVRVERIVGEVPPTARVVIQANMQRTVLRHDGEEIAGRLSAVIEGVPSRLSVLVPKLSADDNADLHLYGRVVGKELAVSFP